MANLSAKLDSVLSIDEIEKTGMPSQRSHQLIRQLVANHHRTSNPFLCVYIRGDKCSVNCMCSAPAIYAYFVVQILYGYIHIRLPTALIIAKIACWTTSEPIEGSDLNLFLTWLRDQLKVSGNEYLQSIARCLQMMLQNDRYRDVFVGIDGINTIVHVLSGRVNFQIQYQLCFCLWILTFNEPLATKMNKYNAIPVLADILSEAVKEKVTRMTLATFRNLIEKPTDAEIIRDNAITMVQCKVLKQLEILQQSGQKFDDVDIKEDIDFLTEKLLASVQDLSSFDEYATEVKSGRLEWSPVHSSDKFWRENASRLNEKNYELLKILVRLLETSKDPLVLSVASHDLGEYVRHYGRGKVVTENLGGKHLVMQLLTHEDPNVRYEALLCVQKLMVQKWYGISGETTRERHRTYERGYEVLEPVPRTVLDLPLIYCSFLCVKSKA
ncbi:unnamed protein product [Oppiella nova]|uniref:ATPase V1 complex subunit H C-terminal domain-containing protein n=2 Tax=Oppiella nova TaxID=334625 RepID=A0A7R9LRG3_9ACAR|nr:unnamed protein product [Oppiella nova]CAG2166182.1 unnamed protein product [Oppiella nova]